MLLCSLTTVTTKLVVMISNLTRGTAERYQWHNIQDQQVLVVKSHATFTTCNYAVSQLCLCSRVMPLNLTLG